MKLNLFDFETTSAKPETTRAVQLAEILIENGSITRESNWLCNPEVDIHHEASEVHGITPDMVKDMPPDYERAAVFANMLLDQQPILATHNGTTFDLPILQRLAIMGGVENFDVSLFNHIDTLVCATRLWPHAPNHKLSNVSDNPKDQGLIQFLKLGTGEGAHDALEDIKMVYMLIQHIISIGVSDNLEQLSLWCEKPKVLEICHFGKHKGKEWGKGPGKVPFWYARYMAENWESASLDIQATLLKHYNLQFIRIRNRLRTLENI